MSTSYLSPRSGAGKQDGTELLSDVGALVGGYDFSSYWTSTERSAAAEGAAQYEAECRETTQRVIELLHEHCAAGKLLAQYRVLIARLAADMRDRDREQVATAAELRRLTDAERAHAATIKQHELTIAARGHTIDGLRAEVRQLEGRVQQRDARIEALLEEIRRPRSPDPSSPAGEPQLGGRAANSETRKTANEQAGFASASEQSRFASDRARWGIGSAMESSFNTVWMRGGTSGTKDGGLATSTLFQRQASERRGEEKERVDVHRVVVSHTKQGEDAFSGYGSDPHVLWN